MIDPNSPLTAGIVEALYNQALGHPPAQATLNGWLNSGLRLLKPSWKWSRHSRTFRSHSPRSSSISPRAAINNAGFSGLNGTAPLDLTPTQVGAIYEAVLQRAPTATEVTAALALDSATGDVGVIAALVNSAAAISNVYPILQMFDLAFATFSERGHFGFDG